MAIYRLKFAEDGIGCEKAVEFHAEDASAALLISQNESPNRTAELWCDGKLLCTIRRDGGLADFWHVNPKNW